MLYSYKSDNFLNEPDSFDAYRQILYDLPLGFAMHQIILDDSGVPIDYIFIDVNPEFMKISGLNHEDIIGKRVREVFPNTESSWIERYGQVALTGKPVSFENYFSEFGKSYHIIAFSYRVNHFAVLVDEFTNIRQIHDQLRESSELLKIAGKAANLGSWSVNLKENRITLSSEVSSILGYPENTTPTFEEAINLFTPAYRQKIVEVFGKLSETGHIINEEAEIIRSDGKRKWIRITGEAFKERENKIDTLRGSIQDIDRLKSTERSAEENRQSMERLIGNLPGIAYRCKYDDAWTMEFISQGCQKMTGYSENEFYKKEINWEQLIDLSDREFVRTVIARCLADKTPFQLEYKIRNRNGKIKWVWEKGIGICDDHGQIVGIEGFISDITERRATENALAESTRNYKDLIDSMNETIWIIDLEGNILDVNKTAVDKLGYSKSELISIGLRGIDCGLTDEMIETLVKDIPTAQFLNFETAHKSKSGKITPVEISSSLVNYHGKKSILSIARDISRRKKDERIQQIIFEIAKTSTNAGAIEDLLISFNDRLLEIFEASDLLVALYDDKTNTLIEASQNKFNNLQWKVDNSLPGVIFKTGQTLILTRENGLRFMHKRGLEVEADFPLLWSGVPLHDNGKTIGVLIVRGTNEKPYDAKVIRLLKTIAHELTVVIQRQRMIGDLIIAKNKAEESDRLKTAFLANISHEIRTPMNGIIGFLDLLRIPNLDEARKEKFIELVNISGQRLLETINKIIETAKLEAGQVELIYSTIDLYEIMLFQYEFFQQQAVSKSLDFKICDMSRIKIRTDKFKLNAILTNLLNNAFKFTEKGSVEFGNYLEGEEIVFFIKDTGIGIPAEKIESVFERFVQADSNVTRPYEGSGLGLSIVRAYLELLKGQIWVESEVGKGSVFYFKIPYIPAVEINVSKIAPADSKNSDASSLKILIAEDDYVSMEFLRTVLESEKIQLIHAPNGSEAVRIIRENGDISMILMDIKMPGMSGLDAARKIREFNSNIPIIAQSAHAFGNDKFKALESGCNDYLAKPVNRLDLLAMIKKYTENST